jgi:Carboxylesterase type B
MKLLVGLLCVFVIASRGLCLEVPLVHIENGAVSGTYKLSTGGNRFLSFEGIPYARPPVGKYRFRVSDFRIMTFKVVYFFTIVSRLQEKYKHKWPVAASGDVQSVIFLVEKYHNKIQLSFL